MNINTLNELFAPIVPYGSESSSPATSVADDMTVDDASSSSERGKHFCSPKHMFMRQFRMFTNYSKYSLFIAEAREAAAFIEAYQAIAIARAASEALVSNQIHPSKSPPFSRRQLPRCGRCLGQIISQNRVTSSPIATPTVSFFRFPKTNAFVSHLVLKKYRFLFFFFLERATFLDILVPATIVCITRKRIRASALTMTNRRTL